MKTRGGFSAYIQREYFSDLIGTVQWNNREYSCRWNSKGKLMDINPVTPALQLSPRDFDLVTWTVPVRKTF